MGTKLNLKEIDEEIKNDQIKKAKKELLKREKNKDNDITK